MIHNGYHTLILDSRYVDCSESRNQAVYNAMFAGCCGNKLGNVCKCVDRATQDLLTLFIHYIDIIDDHEPFFAGCIALTEGADIIPEEVYSVFADIVD